MPTSDFKEPKRTRPEKTSVEIEFNQQFLALSDPERQALQEIINDINQFYQPAVRQAQTLLQAEKPSYAGELEEPLSNMYEIWKRAHRYPDILTKHKEAWELMRTKGPIGILTTSVYGALHLLNESLKGRSIGLSVEVNLRGVKNISFDGTQDSETMMRFRQFILSLPQSLSAQNAGSLWDKDREYNIPLMTYNLNGSITQSFKSDD